MKEIIKERLTEHLPLLDNFINELPVLQRFISYIATEEKDTGNVLFDTQEATDFNTAVQFVGTMVKNKEILTNDNTTKIEMLISLAMDIASIGIILKLVLKTRYYNSVDMEQSGVLNEIIKRLEDLRDELILLAEIHDTEI